MVIKGKPPAFSMFASLFLALCFQPPEPAPARTERLAAWESLGYGMFIHFGMSTFTGDEYGATPARSEVYAPTALDPEQWVLVARRSGMRYAVLTTKHCYGHCLWDSKFSDYDVASSKVPRDVVREFTEACKKHGIEAGLYYLLGWDAYHQARRTPLEYEQLCRNQLTELLTGYGPIGELWLDIPWDLGPDTQGALGRLYRRIKELQPTCLVLLNQGLRDGQQIARVQPTWRRQPAHRDAIGLWPTDLVDGERTPPPEGGHAPRQRVADQERYLPMEVCDTLAEHWFWVEQDGLRSVRTLVRLHEQARSRGANFLLDVAPDRTGRIPDAAVVRLHEMHEVLTGKVPLPVNLARGAGAKASNVHAGDPRWRAEAALDEDSRTRWATDAEVRTAWLEVDLGSEQTFTHAYLSEGWDRVRRFAIEVADGDGWRAIHDGTRIGGDGLRITLPKTTARRVRLTVLDSTGGPTIRDFELQ